MKTLKRSLWTKVNQCIARLLSLLGVSGLAACAVEYGPPMYAPYYEPVSSVHILVSGRVETYLHTPIPHVGIELASHDSLLNTLLGNSLSGHCDELGQFVVHCEIYDHDYPTAELMQVQELTLVAKDIDGARYGSFKSDSVNVVLTVEKEEYADYVYGHAVANDIVITLQEEQNEQE